MTVRYQLDDERAARNAEKAPGVYCNWLDDSGRPQAAIFAAEQLELKTKRRKDNEADQEA